METISSLPKKPMIKKNKKDPKILIELDLKIIKFKIEIL